MAEKLLPKVFRKNPPYILTYDWIDDADGTGFVGYFLFSTEDNSDKDYHLGRNVVYSRDVEVLNGTDEDFDLTTFNKARTIKGTAIITIPWNIDPNAVAMSYYVTCRIRKYNSVTGETEIANVISNTASSDIPVFGLWNMKVVIPETLFKAGETLRLTIISTISGGGGAKWWRYGIDPKNRAGANANPVTEGRIFIPFKIQN